MVCENCGDCKMLMQPLLPWKQKSSKHFLKKLTQTYLRKGVVLAWPSLAENYVEIMAWKVFDNQIIDICPSARLKRNVSIIGVSLFLCMSICAISFTFQRDLSNRSHKLLKFRPFLFWNMLLVLHSLFWIIHNHFLITMLIFYFLKNNFVLLTTKTTNVRGKEAWVNWSMRQCGFH